MGIFHSKCFSQTQLVRVGDDKRQFTLYVPAQLDTSQKVPLLLNFHGSGMTAIEQMMYSQTNTIADREGILIAYPQGKNNDWNVGFGMDYDDGNDVQFIDTLLIKLVKNYPIDPNKIYAVGLSRGGFFIHRLIAELPNKIKGFASIGAPIPNRVKEQLAPQTLVKAMYVHGTADHIVAINGKVDAYLSVEKSLEFWKKNNKVESVLNTTHFDAPLDETSVSVQLYGENQTVCSIIIKNGGHTWPGADPFNIGFPLGKTSQDFDFNTYFWEFLNH